MNPKIFEQLEELRESCPCCKSYRCLSVPIKDMCQAKYHAISNTMECLERHPENCEFSTKAGIMQMCECPLRKFIALHFNEIYTGNKN